MKRLDVSSRRLFIKKGEAAKGPHPLVFVLFLLHLAPGALGAVLVPGEHVVAAPERTITPHAPLSDEVHVRFADAVERAREWRTD